MRECFRFFAAFSLLLACTPQETKTDNQSGEADKTVHVTGITLDQTTATVKDGESIMLVATITPENANNKDVIWSSSSDAVAVVDNNGRVTGVKAGSATITATAVDGEKTATCSLSVETNLAPSITMDASHISAISVVLAGKVNTSLNLTSDLTTGIMWSKNEDVLPANSNKAEATIIDDGYNYSVGITGLEPETTYYYRSYVTRNGQSAYGETKSFTTRELSSLLTTWDATEIEATSANISAFLDLTDVQYVSKEYGFYWGMSESDEPTKLKCEDITENSFSASLEKLSHHTQYWYKAYVELDNKTFYGQVKTFITGVIPVDSVSLDKTEYIFYTIGDSLTLKAIVFPEEATDKNVEWNSSDDNVAMVSPMGVIKAVANGTATVTATTKDQEKKATCAITVDQLVTGISLNKETLRLNEGETETLIITISPSNVNNSTVTWTSSDESVAKVDQTGLVTAISKGTATIIATANDMSGKSASCEVKVKRLVSSIVLDKTSIAIYRGQKETITSSVSPSTATDKRITWTSSSYAAMVSEDGIISGYAVGSAIITATAKDGSGVSATCFVEVKQHVTSISLNETSLDLIEGNTCMLTASISPENASDKELIWSSDNPSIAGVDGNGHVTALARGKAIIMASANDGSGIHATCNVIVSSSCPAGAIDLGFSSYDGYKLYWATSNLSTSGLCANSEDYGDYYAWGETEPYYSSLDPITMKDGKESGYLWPSYKWCNGDYSYLTKYNWNSERGPVDNRTVLDLEDDAANAILGGKWRMPTTIEWDRLKKKCTWTWMKKNDVNGIEVIGPNGNRIFIPACGTLGVERAGLEEPTPNLYGSGSFGRYWSCTLYPFYSPEYACAMWFYLEQNELVLRDINESRIMGLPIRPVYE